MLCDLKEKVWTKLVESDLIDLLRHKRAKTQNKTKKN